MFTIREADPDDDNASTTRSKYFSARLKTTSQTITTGNSVDTTPSPSSSASVSSTAPSKSGSIAEDSGQKASQKSSASSTDTTGEDVGATRRQPAVFANTLLVNPNQKANKLLRHLRCPYQLSAAVSPAHYVMYESCCAVFLSLKYHVIYPNYIYDTLNALRNAYQLKVLLVLVDHIEYQSALKELTQVAIRTGCTLMLCWSYDEAANYIDNYRHFGDKTPDIIMGKTGAAGSASDSATEYGRVVDALTTVRSINKTDAVSLIRTFDTIENIVRSDADQLIICPGMAALKAQRLREFFNKPFIRSD